LEVAFHEEFEGPHICIELREVEIDLIDLEIKLLPLPVNRLTVDFDQAKYSADQQDRGLILCGQVVFIFQKVVTCLVLGVGRGRRDFQAGREKDFQHFQENQDWLFKLLLYTLQQLAVEVFFVLA
jgi:hypothetical protein